MKRFLAVSAVLLALSAVGSGVHAQQMMRPEPLDPANPVAQRVTAVVRLLMDTDVDAAIAYVRAHSTPVFTADAASEIVRALMTEASTYGRDYHLEAVASGPGNDYLAMLRHRDGGPPLPIIFEIEPGAPYHIVAMRRAGGTRPRSPGTEATLLRQ